MSLAEVTGQNPRWEFIFYNWYTGLWDLHPDFLIKHDCTVWCWVWFGACLDDRPDVSDVMASLARRGLK